MIYFLYDSDGYYLGNSNIETENSTTIEPTLKDGYWSRFNGKKWNTEKIAESAADLDGVIIPDIALEGVSASNHDKELYSLFERYLDDKSYIVKDAENKTLTFKVLTEEEEKQQKEDEENQQILDHKIDELIKEMAKADLMGDEDWKAELREQYNALMETEDEE